MKGVYLLGLGAAALYLLSRKGGDTYQNLADGQPGGTTPITSSNPGGSTNILPPGMFDGANPYTWAQGNPSQVYEYNPEEWGNLPYGVRENIARGSDLQTAMQAAFTDYKLIRDYLNRLKSGDYAGIMRHQYPNNLTWVTGWGPTQRINLIQAAEERLNQLTAEWGF